MASKKFDEYMTPEDFENEFGMAKQNQAKYRLEDEARMKYFRKFIPRMPYIYFGGNIYYERDKIKEWLEFFRKA
ncbi:hypothetical protein GZ989_011360 (plasmid) [Campylobacter fetus]|uniref:Uncharacterized protein n=1 Tax=Campylobacter fetus TaxID=196 RepID=A0A974RN44_CAMFE|nr:hypothetical protein [Campylobacter fetus]OCS32901.1 hypothetical protein AWR31_08155 [Campylobacter fetus subsp. venerealis]QMS59904.1 hypothetical protein GZ989_011360 [Campylobacter fetus]